MSASTTDRTAAHANIIAEIYRAFVRRDVPAILDRIAPECRWELWADNRAQRAGIPTMQPRVGPAGVADFFSAVAQLEMHDFRLLDILASERQCCEQILAMMDAVVSAAFIDDRLVGERLGASEMS